MVAGQIQTVLRDNYCFTPLPSWDTPISHYDHQQIANKFINPDIKNNNNNRRKQNEHDHTLPSLLCFLFLFFVYLSMVLCSSLRLEMVFGRQTTSFCCAAVISCGISGLDVPPQISQALQGGLRVQASRISNYCVELLI